MSELNQVRRERDAARSLLQTSVDLIDLLDWENDPDPNIVQRIETLIKQAREALLYGKALRKSSTESDWRLASCTWTQDEDDGFWYTECGNAYEFMEDGPEENNHKFCPYCGGHLAALLTRPNG